MPTYLPGDKIILQATFRDTNGTLVTPAQVALRIKDPAGSVVTITALSPGLPSPGIYEHHYDLEGLAPGTYIYQWKSDGTYDAVGEGVFLVAKPRVP